MSTQVAIPTSPLASLVLHGDLSQMSGEQKVSYYLDLCKSLGLSPHSQPFAIIKFQGKEVMYAKKDATEQLRKIHGISVIDLTNELQGEVFVVTCKVKDASGKTDMSTGVVATAGLKGEALANALMKAETKAKRRATLSICGLGMLDESEIETVDVNAVVMDIPQAPARRPLTVDAFGKAITRIQSGETDLIKKLRDTMALTDAQLATLVLMEDANLPVV